MPVSAIAAPRTANGKRRHDELLKAAAEMFYQRAKPARETHDRKSTCNAKARGKREIKTWNATTNRPMLRINEAMGFVKQPAWIRFEKDLRSAITRATVIR